MYQHECKNGSVLHLMKAKDYSPLRIFETPEKLSIKLINKVENKKINHKKGFCITIKKGSVNLFHIEKLRDKKGKERWFIRNISNNPWEFERTVNSRLNSFFYDYDTYNPNHKTHKLVERKHLLEAKRCYFRNWIYRKLIEKGIDMPKMNMKKCDLKDIILVACYPLFRELYRYTGKTHTYLKMYIPSRKLRKIKTVKEITKIIFKTTNRRIMREVAKSLNKNISSIIVMRVVLGDLIPLDYYEDFNEMEFSRFLPTTYNNRVREILQFYSPRKIVNLINGCKDFNLIDDSARQWQLYKDKIKLPKRPKSIEELHNYLSNEARKLMYEDFELPINESLKEVHDWYLCPPIKKIFKKEDLDLTEKIELFRFVAPKSRFEMIDWGQKMGNCIASYAERVKRGDCIILGVYKDKDLKYNIEIRNRIINQFYAKNNTKPDIKDENCIRKFLIEKNVISKYCVN